MNNLNSLIVEGTITKVDVNRPQSGGVTAVITLAVERNFKDSDGKTVAETEEFDAVAYGRLADCLEREAEAGRGVRVVGRLSQRKWADTDGRWHSGIAVAAEHIEFKPRKASESNER